MVMQNIDRPRFYDGCIEPAVAIRHGFQPPRYPLKPLAANTEQGWSAIPTLPLFIDLQGEEICERQLMVRVAYDDEFFYLRASGVDTTLTLHPELPVDAADFWRQDHLELRLILNDNPADCFQLILALDGRCWDNHGFWRNADALTSSGSRNEDNWQVQARISRAACTFPILENGNKLLGLVSHTRWADGFADIATISATELGFQQTERYAEFFVDDDTQQWPQVTTIAFLQPMLRASENLAQLILHNPYAQPLRGRLIIWREGAEQTGGDSLVKQMTLDPGETDIPLRLKLTRPQFTRFVFRFERAGLSHEMCAVSLRASVPPLPTVSCLAHPYLYFTPERIAELQRKAENPTFAYFVERLRLNDNDFSLDDIPTTSEETTLLFQNAADISQFFHLCKQLSDESQHEAPGPVRRIWSMLSAEARAVVTRSHRQGSLDEEDQTLLVAAINVILRDSSFYNENDFASIHLTDEARQLLTSKDRTQAESIRLNRILLLAAFPLILGSVFLRLLFPIWKCLSKWVLSQDKRLIQVATAYITAADKLLILGEHTELHEGMISGQLALAYDAFYPYLSSKERQLWQRVLGQFLQIHLHTARTRHWNCTAIPNANSVCNGGGGLLALALLAEHSEAPESLYLAQKLITLHLDYCYGPQGGNTEGLQYWAYGFSNFMVFADCLESTLGSDQGLLHYAAVTLAMNNIKMALSNDGKLHGFNDTVPMPMGYEIAWWYAARFDDAFALWWGDTALRVYLDLVARNKPTAYQPDPLLSLLYRADLPVQHQQPPLPLCYVQEDIQYGILRSANNYDCRLEAGIKGSRPPYTHHNQPDTGSFYLDVRGERLLIDPGYYKDLPTDHSLPIINGVAPHTPIGYTGKIIESRNEGIIHYLACDVTPAYCDAAERIIRHLVMVGEEGLILLDDIAAPGGTVLAQYQCGGVTEAIACGQTVMIRGDHAKVCLDLYAPADIQLTLLPERTFHDTHWGYHFAECRWFPVTGTYLIHETCPLITTILDATETTPTAPTVTRTDGHISITLPSGTSVFFQYFDGRWQLDMCRTNQDRPDYS